MTHDTRVTSAARRLVFDVVQDIFFFADIVLNFHTGYITQGAIVMDPDEIRRNYLSVGRLCCRQSRNKVDDGKM